MTENLFTAVLTFSLVAGGATAIGSEMFTTREAPKVAASQVIVLPPVTIIGRSGASTRVAMAESVSPSP